MSNKQQVQANRIRPLLVTLSIICALTGLGGCAENTSTVQMDNPELAAYVQLIMPTRVEIQSYWTKPVSFAGDGRADGIEMILSVFDSFGDLTKIVGTLHVELHTRRSASADRLDKRLAFWPIELNSRKSLIQHWDPLARFYRFPLELAEAPLPPGRYILTVRLVAPNGERLSDEYEFTHEASSAPPANFEP
ncbi:MAG: hypothetical protein ABIG44_19360 [Planctomycetota bacterium]